MIPLAMLTCALSAVASYVCSSRQVLLRRRPPLLWRLASAIVPGVLSLWAWAAALGPVAGPCAGLVAWMLMLTTLPWVLLPGRSAQELS
jgi:hypothetical protein